MSQENDGLRTFDLDASMTLPVSPYLRVKMTTAGAVALAGPVDETIGTTFDNPQGADTTVTVKTWNYPGTRKVTCASTCSINDKLYPTTNGQVDTLNAATGLGTNGAAVGPAKFVALEACSASGGVIEAIPLGDKGGPLFTGVGDSTAAGTSSVAENFFDTNTVTLAAGLLKKGDILRIRARAVATATHSTDTFALKLYLGTVTLAAPAAFDAANADEMLVDITVVVTDVGATGHVKGFGFTATGAPGTAALKELSLGSTVIDTTAAAVIRGSITVSVSDPGNAAVLRDLIVELVRQ